MKSLLLHSHRWSPYQEMNFQDLVGREPGPGWGGRLEPLRIWDSSIFTGRVGRYNMCCYGWVHESLQGSSLLPLRGVGVSRSLSSTRLGFVWRFPMSSGLEVSSMRSMPCRTACAAVAFSMVLHGARLQHVGLPAQGSLLSCRTPWRRPIGRRREQALKEKPAKRNLEVSAWGWWSREIHLPLHRLPVWLDLARAPLLMLSPALSSPYPNHTRVSAGSFKIHT